MEDDGDFEYFGYWLPSGQNFEKFFILRGEKIYYIYLIYILWLGENVLFMVMVK